VTMNAMKFLVTGATGFGGSRVACVLTCAGHSVRLLAPGPTKETAVLALWHSRWRS
jgi:uncharacterized protein YbjT (DUF2867 family)